MSFTADAETVPANDDARGSNEDARLSVGRDDETETDGNKAGANESLTGVDQDQEMEQGQDGRLDEDDGGGLFGSDVEDEAPVTRTLEDHELDSGDDEDRNDRMGDDMEVEEGDEEHQNVMDVKLGRHAVPIPSDNELYLLQVPPFFAIEPHAFHQKVFQPPTTDHHSTNIPSRSFSAYKTATTTLRWRHSALDPSKIQSNARVIRWSDGSLTLQLASNATDQYELPAKPLAPPKVRDPTKPTPTSISGTRKANGQIPYESQLDSHTYLTSPHEASSLLRISNQITTALNALPTEDVADEALVQLQEKLAAAVRGNKTTADGGVGVISITEDPELAKRKAEVAEREKLRAQRRREQADARDRDRATRVVGRSGVRTGAGGLTVGGLEDEEGTSMPRARAKPAKSRARKSMRTDEYSDEEEYQGRGRTKEDEYDMNDDFLAGSDEEEEVGEGSEDDVDDGIVEPAVQKKTVAERQREIEVDEVGEVFARSKKRRIVDDEEDD
ncbi:MAG: hypothetical protein M1812_001691 [Candelaria pacifica]|nr:MAG: hypothetical protein M1812_001691 [Candelaria pacifica]